MLKLKDIASKLQKNNYMMIFDNKDLIFDDFAGNLSEELLNRNIKNLEYLEGTDLSIDLQ